MEAKEMKKSVVISQRAFGMDHAPKRITSVVWFDREYPVGPWNDCVDLKLELPGHDWSMNYKKTRQLVEAFFAGE